MTLTLKQTLTRNQYFLPNCGPQVKKRLRRNLLEIIEPQETSPLSELRALTRDFLAKHPRLTIQALATRANVPVTSLRRILSETSKSEVAPHTALNLCAYITREKNIGALLEMLPEALGEYLSKHFGSFIFSGNQDRAFSPDLNSILQDSTKYMIYKLASNRGGVAEEQIIELFGQHGKRSLDELVELSLLEVFENQIVAKDKSFSLDLETAAKHLPMLASLYRPEELPHGLNLMYSLSERLSELAIIKIKDIQREAVKQCHEVMQDANSFGDIPYFTINLCESFTSAKQELLQ